MNDLSNILPVSLPERHTPQLSLVYSRSRGRLTLVDYGLLHRTGERRNRSRDEEEEERPRDDRPSVPVVERQPAITTKGSGDPEAP